MHNLLVGGKVKQFAVYLLIPLIIVDPNYVLVTIPSTREYSSEQNRQSPYS